MDRRSIYSFAAALLLAAPLRVAHAVPLEVPEPALVAARAELAKERPFSADAYRKLFLAMWAQVPNWKSGDPLWIKRAEPPPPVRVPGQPRPKRPPPHEPEKIDWVEALRALDLAELSVPFAFQEMPKVELPPVPLEQATALREDALRVLTAMRALGKSGRADAVEPLFRLAFVADGVFRDECGRQIRAIGDAAVAPLVRLQYQKGPPAAPLNKQRRYAVYQLDRMDRARPSKAVEKAADDRLRAELLHAYGEVRALDAVEAVLEQVNAQSHRVKREARWAFRRYVEGPPPPPAPKRKRKLPGGKEESVERADYLTYREVAELALQKRLAEVGITLPEAHPTALAMFEAIIGRDDAERATEWERAFLAARERADAGDVAAAVDEYEWILAHDPATSRRVEMSPAFARLADLRRQEGKLDEAVGLYWKASALAAADAPEAKKLEADACFLDAERAEKAGRTDEEALRRALRADPHHPRARVALAQLEAARLKLRIRRGGAALLAMLAVLIVGAWLLLRPHKPAPPAA